MPKQKTRVPAVEGLFVMDEENPRLIGGRGKTRGSYFFPKDLAGGDPGCAMDEEREEVMLSPRGKVWSYTTAAYPPPLPFIIIKEPWEPYVLAAVELEEEKLVVLGQMTEETALEDVSVGMEVDLVLDVLYEDDENEYIAWKWKPVAS